MRAVWIVVFVLALFSAPLLADPPMTTLRIEVKSLSGKPIERASVVVRFVDGRSIAKFGKKVRVNWETRTSMEGVAKIPPLPQGEILIQVIAKGFQTFGGKFEIDEPAKTVEIKLNPPQPQYSVHE